MTSRQPVGSRDQGTPVEIRRKGKSPSDLRREAKRLRLRIESAARDRHEAYAEGDCPDTTEHLTVKLGRMFNDKRGMKREVYAAAGQEGTPVYRGTPGGRHDA